MNYSLPKTNSFTGAGHIPYVSLLLGAAAFLLHGSGNADRFALHIADPTLTDMFTCHWVHWSNQHLLWSGGAFVLLGALCERHGRNRMLALVATSIVLISLSLLLVPGEIGAYGGLSGIDSAFFGLF